MSRRESVVVTPGSAAAVFRRSARILQRKNGDDMQKPRHGMVSSSFSAPGLMEDEEASRKSRRALVREVTKRLLYPPGGSISGENLKNSPESNGSMDRLCSVRRSPRFSSGGGSVNESSSEGRKFGKAVLARCNTKCEKGNTTPNGSCSLRRSPRFSSGVGSVGQSFSERSKLEKSVLVRSDVKSETGKGKENVDSSDRVCSRRKRSELSKTNETLGACDRDKVRAGPTDQKRKKRDKPSVHTNGIYREERNGLSCLNVDLTEEIKGEKRREITVGLIARPTSLIIDRGNASSSAQSVVKADEVEMTAIDGRGDGVRSKMNKLDGVVNCGAIQMWTEEQEMALQNAYLTAKPSPNFWKKVSKLVPGKSAQECFDKVHSDLITPRQPQPRSRAKKANLSPIPQFSLSASKLLKPTRPKAKIPSRRTQVAKKTVRHILEKQCNVDRGQGLDLFSVLEPSIQSNVLSTPTGKRANLETIRERSSSIHNKLGSRFTSGDTTTVISPPVLKQVKNKALHEKYIDQLHLRDAKRKLESEKVSGKENIKPIDARRKDLAVGVKNNLIYDVKDAIEKLKGLEADNSSSSSECCYNGGESEEEEDECE